MIERTKTVYYCQFCKRHGLSRYAMEGHERRCTLNPDRACRWGGAHEPDTARWADVIRSRSPLTKDDIAWLRNETDGCPPCMLAALRQSGLADFHYDTETSERIFDYDEEIAAYRKGEREDEYRISGYVEMYP